MRKRALTIAQYIKDSPRVRQPHLRAIHAILKSVAPEAEETIKWGVPFFIEPRFLFSFSGHTSHCNFAPMARTLEHFRKELKGHQTTSNFLQIPYDEVVPEKLIRKLAKYRVANIGEGDGFW